MRNLIEVKNLTYFYEPAHLPALKDLSFSIAAGEYLALIGANGCGKTTLIRHFNALLIPASGTVEVDGMDTCSFKQQLEIRRRVGMIFQNPDHQIVGTSVEEDVAFGPGNLGLPAAEIRQRVDRSLEMVGLKNLAKRSPYQLSGGQKQLLAIAGLLAMEPNLIILDEPTASLDPESRIKILDLLQKLNAQGISILHVTQNMDEAALAKRVLVMDQGQIIADASPAEILSRVEWLKELGLAPPQITELMWRLQQAGIAVSGNIFTFDAAVAAIQKALK